MNLPYLLASLFTSFIAVSVWQVSTRRTKKVEVWNIVEGASGLESSCTGTLYGPIRVILNPPTHSLVLVIALNMLSPPASAASPSSTNTNGQRLTSRNLPTPRQHSLLPGSLKETQLIDYLDNHVLRVSRRYGKKFSNERTDNDDTPGYTSFDQVVADVDPLVDVVWISGTREFTIFKIGTHYQVPYMWFTTPLFEIHVLVHLLVESYECTASFLVTVPDMLF